MWHIDFYVETSYLIDAVGLLYAMEIVTRYSSNSTKVWNKMRLPVHLYLFQIGKIERHLIKL